MSNFQPLEVVGRGSETQLQVAEFFFKCIEHFSKSTAYKIRKYFDLVNCFSYLRSCV